MNSTVSRFRAAALALVAVSAQAQDPCPKNHYILDAPAGCEWIRAASLATPRIGHTATLLADGRVLVAGGVRAEELDPYSASGRASHRSVEVYDPAAGTWRNAAPMLVGRQWHTATRLLDGRVLVAGGDESPGTRVWADDGDGAVYMVLMGGTTAEIYDPLADTWTRTASFAQTEARVFQQTATMLPDGRVLVAGGTLVMFDDIVNAEIYDPFADRWTPAGSTGQWRWGHTASLLPGGKVLLAGGANSGYQPFLTSDVYEPAQAWWNVAAAGEPRVRHASTTLRDGRVLVSGGWRRPFVKAGFMRYDTLRSVEVFDPQREAWTRISDLAMPRYAHTSTLLADGAILTVGGVASVAPAPERALVAAAELRLVDLGTSMPIGKLNDPRMEHTTTLLVDGSVLVVGGRGIGDRVLDSAELLGAR